MIEKLEPITNHEIQENIEFTQSVLVDKINEIIDVVNELVEVLTETRETVDEFTGSVTRCRPKQRANQDGH